MWCASMVLRPSRAANCPSRATYGKALLKEDHGAVTQCFHSVCVMCWPACAEPALYDEEYAQKLSKKDWVISRSGSHVSGPNLLTSSLTWVSVSELSQ